MDLQRQSKRDIPLTMLIDLLVQIVFVFTLLLLASGALEGGPEERGYVTPEVWKTLVSAFDADPNKPSATQAKEIGEKYKQVRQELDEAAHKRNAMQKTINDQDKRIAELEKQKGAPGYPPCRAADSSEIVVLNATIDVSGRVAVNWLEDGKALAAQELPFGEPGRWYSRQEFRRTYLAWREHGLKRNPQCLFAASARYDPRAPAGEYHPTAMTIWTIFRINKMSRSDP